MPLDLVIVSAYRHQYDAVDWLHGVPMAKIAREHRFQYSTWQLLRFMSVAVAGVNKNSEILSGFVDVHAADATHKHTPVA